MKYLRLALLALALPVIMGQTTCEEQLAAAAGEAPGEVAGEILRGQVIIADDVVESYVVGTCTQDLPIYVLTDGVTVDCTIEGEILIHGTWESAVPIE